MRYADFGPYNHGRAKPEPMGDLVMDRHTNKNQHRPFCLSRRGFLLTTGALAGHGLIGCATTTGRAPLTAPGERPAKACGPASQYVPKVEAAFVRRESEYGMRWPGAIYDGETARAQYATELAKAAQDLGIELALRESPIYSLEAGMEWIAAAESRKADALLVMLLDRQEHAWPTAKAASDSPVPTIVFSPVGSSFTTNTSGLAHAPGTVICSTDDFSQVVSRLNMVRAGAKLRETRFVMLKGAERRETSVAHIGTTLQYLPEKSFLEEYQNTPTSDEILSIAQYYIDHAQAVCGPCREDVINGVKSYAVARTILERERGDGISMNCLGALGNSNVSLPCIAWSRMLDQGVPAACEADVGACLTHALVLYLFGKPGFQQDPVADTGDKTLIGAHCTCPTRLDGCNCQPEPFNLSYHHGKRDAVPVPTWRKGQRVSIADIELRKDAPPRMLISTGDVVDNVAVPPAGGCVVSVKVRVDDAEDMLAFPGFHQIFFYGDHKDDLAAFCQLHGMEATIV